MKKYISPQGVDKNAVLENVVKMVTDLFEGRFTDGWELEMAVVETVYAIGQLMMSALLAEQCHRDALAEIGKLEEKKRQTVRFRLDQGSWNEVQTTLGRVSFPRFAYRFCAYGGSVISKTPPCSALPALEKRRTTLLLLRLEAAVGSRLPFRQAAELLKLVTHNHVILHDSTIAAHNLVLAEAMDRKWLYSEPDKIAEVLQARATQDQSTGKPLLFFSSDAHAEHLYEDNDTFKSEWKMLNGIRIWALDKHSGRLIHIGGEFITGDCHALAAVFDDLNERGILPFDGSYDGVQAQLVFVADGMPWFEEHIRAKFTGLGTVLDVYHALQHIAKFLSKVARRRGVRYKLLFAALRKYITGTQNGNKQPSRKLRSSPRPKNTEKATSIREFPLATPSAIAIAEDFELPSASTVQLLLEIENIELSKVASKRDKQLKARETLLEYLITRIDHIQYSATYARGWLLGSGPMESFNRLAQSRLKVPGATWTYRMAQAMLNLRLLHGTGRIQDFWNSAQSRTVAEEAFLNAV